VTILIGTPHTHNAGYYMNDDRESGGKKVEADVQTCGHCQKVILMQVWKEQGNWCNRHQGPICEPCGERMVTRGCELFTRSIEEAMNRDYHRAQFRKMAGV
jgi:hypothetical protein